jgi:hypothetical protein
MTAHVSVADSGKEVRVVCAACELDETHGRNYPAALEAATQHNRGLHNSVLA